VDSLWITVEQLTLQSLKAKSISHTISLMHAAWHIQTGDRETGRQAGKGQKYTDMTNRLQK